MKVEVKTPFPFCEKCNFRELQESRIYAENKLQESFFYCVNQHKCENVLDLAQRERYAQWLDGRIVEWISVDDRLPENDDEVLVAWKCYGEKRVSTDCYTPRAGRWDVEHRVYSHWATFPLAPETEEQNDG